MKLDDLFNDNDDDDEVYDSLVSVACEEAVRNVKSTGVFNRQIRMSEILVEAAGAEIVQQVNVALHREFGAPIGSLAAKFVFSLRPNYIGVLSLSYLDDLRDNALGRIWLETFGEEVAIPDEVRESWTKFCDAFSEAAVRAHEIAELLHEQAEKTEPKGDEND